MFTLGVVRNGELAALFALLVLVLPMVLVLVLMLILLKVFCAAAAAAAALGEPDLGEGLVRLGLRDPLEFTLE